MNHVKREDNGRILLDDEAERILREKFTQINELDDKVNEIIHQPVNEHIVSVNEQLYNFIIDEMESLREQNDKLLQQLEEERQYNKELVSHNKELSSQMLPLISQAQELANNAQTLHAIENVKPQLKEISEGNDTSNNKSLWQKLFKNKKK